MIEQGKCPGRAKPRSQRLVKAAVLLFSFLFLALAAFQAKPERTVAQGIPDEILAQQLEVVTLRTTWTKAGANTVVEVPVSKATYITSNLPDTNYGAAPELRQGYKLDGNLVAQC